MMGSGFLYFVFIASRLMWLTDGLLEKKQHQTNASLEKMNDLTCYHCSTMNDKERCQNLTAYAINSTLGFQHKCKGDKKTCMVKRYSYSTSITSANSSHVHHIKMWSLERSCTNKCENGCIVIGERTKLYACTACCSTNLCNTGNAAHSLHLHDWFQYLNLVFVFNFFII